MLWSADFNACDQFGLARAIVGRVYIVVLFLNVMNQPPCSRVPLVDAIGDDCRPTTNSQVESQLLSDVDARDLARER